MAAFDEIIVFIQESKSYVLEAGAGSGKTYTLIQTLNYLIENKGETLKRLDQKISCITYTNVAKNEINKRIENNDLVQVSTIHEFLWSTIKQFQKHLKIELCKLNEINLKKDIDKGKAESRYIENLSHRIDLVESVMYNDTSFNDFENGIIQHDDVIEIARMMYKSYPLLTDIVAEKYPYLFVDEYQDTAEDTIICLIDYLLGRNIGKIVIGFYGDSHQKIYDYGIGDLEKYYVTNGGLIELVKKEENYRSSKSVVQVLNNFRKNIQQIPQSNFIGNATFFYWGSHPEKPKKDIRKFNAEILTTKNSLYDGLIEKLLAEGWSFSSSSNDRILVLANSRVAHRAGFGGLYSIFSRRFGQSTKERLMDRNHPLINFFAGTIDKKTSQERKTGLEHLLGYWKDNNDNYVIRFIRRNGILLSGEFRHAHKKMITEVLDNISDYRTTATVKEVFELVKSNGLIFNKRLHDFIEKIALDPELILPEERERQQKDKELFNSFMDMPYSELLNFWEHIQKNTVFSTKHGTKGDEFRNVLAVIDDTEWPQEYNFKNFFNGTEDNNERFLRTRNLFYVECSRAIENLNILCLSDLDKAAIDNVRSWFGAENVIPIEDYLSP
ncbi:UvrD-helicase domain-containing protein [Flavobacterium sp.]|uniref:UvrD-helicase domain-containing protein n=1 Tax=Flavobacterium sp. TaxID=239 RepID=UPI00261A7C4D|nr:UvrD-helicase domain-containing protein [Flavobacterium sp.]